MRKSRRRRRASAITNTSNVACGFAATRQVRRDGEPKAVCRNSPNKHQFAVRLKAEQLAVRALRARGGKPTFHTRPGKGF
jgi:hypothetical protein